MPADPNSRLSRQLRQLRALVAPLAARRDSVVADEQMLLIARQVCDALLDEEVERGLTHSQLLGAVDAHLRDAAGARIDVFVELGLLQTYTPKNHQQRYVLNMAGYIGLMVAERICRHGGVEELLHLLSDTAQRIEAGEISEELVAEQLIEARRTLIGLANELHRRRHTDTLRELAGHARDHDAEQITAQVASLNVLVAKHFPALSERGAALIRAAQSYTRELEAVTVKLIAEGAASRDFSYLDVADYDEAARTASAEMLSAVGESLLFDLGAVPVSALAVADALDGYQPRRTTRIPPPIPPASTDPDPIGRWEQRRARQVERLDRQAELHLQGADEVSMTDTLRAGAWSGVVQNLAALLFAHQLTDGRYRLELADSVLIDTAAGATYFSPATLRRGELPLPSGAESARDVADTDAAELERHLGDTSEEAA